MPDILQIDGGYHEGGGQIVRTALALSTILKKPFVVDNIRKARINPGLKQQHIYCVKALEELCGAISRGVEICSTRMEYEPKKILRKNLDIDIGTAGSVGLLMQAILLPCLFAGKKMRIKLHGGTDTKWAMPFDYFREVFLPQLRRYCISIEARLLRRGYYPKGNGIIEVIITPKYSLEEFGSPEEFLSKLISESPMINIIEQGHLLHIKGVSHASLDLQSAKVAERQAREAKRCLSRFNCPINIREEYSEASSTGTGITLWAIFSKEVDEINYLCPIILGADSLGEKGKRAEAVGKDAAEKLGREILSNAPVDSHLADSLIPFIGLFGGQIKVSMITPHTETSIYVAERFLGKLFNINSESSIISVVSI